MGRCRSRREVTLDGVTRRVYGGINATFLSTGAVERACAPLQHCARALQAWVPRGRLSSPPPARPWPPSPPLRRLFAVHVVAIETA